jgi:putative phosphoesterase
MWGFMIAAIADVHSNLEALKKVFGKIKNCEMILNAGDIVGYNANPNECVDVIRKSKIKSVLGNHDHACITGDTVGMNPIAAEAVAWTRKRLGDDGMKCLRKLPEKLEIVYKGKRIVVLHGSPADPINDYVFPWTLERIFEKFLKDAKADILILGHTHVPFVKKLECGIVVNPGSVGQPRDHNRDASYALIDVIRMDAKIFRVDYDIPKVCDEILRAGLPDFLAERLFFGL